MENGQSQNSSLHEDCNQMTTIAQGKEQRESKGPWEAKVSYGGEADLHQHYNSCKKNPGHQNFVPVDKFTVNDLPPQYRYNELVEIIKVISDLTVRVSVKYISDKRPKTWSDSGKTFPHYSDSPRERMRVGTGWVAKVIKYYKPCTCRECLSSSSPQSQYAEIYIRTVAHVVYDGYEGERTTCHLFFDSEGTPDRCSNVVTLNGMSFIDCNVKHDNCKMRYLTHDISLADRLNNMTQAYSDLHGKFIQSYKTRYILDENSVPQPEKMFFIIVSHPHGCSKQVSFGYQNGLDLVDRNYGWLTYDVPTCPGSSGAYVFSLRCHAPMLILLHGRNCEDNTELNYSVYDFDYTFFLDPADTIPQQYQCQLCPGYVAVDSGTQTRDGHDRPGPWEVEVSCRGEEELHEHYKICEKNPGHQKFIPVDQFNVNHLPHGYQNSDLVAYIKLVSDLTVRLSVKCVSEKRPKPWPGSDCQRDITLTGTGYVTDVDKVSMKYRNCMCQECLESPTPKSEFADIYIRTAVHVVYDEFEGAHATCDFFFHEHGTDRDVFTLSKVSDVRPVKEKNICDLIFVTHDLNLADRLKDKLTNRQTINAVKIYLLRPPQSHEIGQSLVIIVSYLHGCSKQVSLGFCTRRYRVDGYGYSQLTYSTATCPGSAGAMVCMLNNAEWKWNLKHVHCGRCEANNELNHSILGHEAKFTSVSSYLRPVPLNVT